MVIAERDGFEPVVIKDADDVIGIVTVHDGPSLPDGRDHRADAWATMPAVPATYHNNFQDPERFLRPAASAAASCRCSWRARTTSTACSRRSR